MDITNTYVVSVNGLRGSSGGDFGAIHLISDENSNYQLEMPEDNRHNVLWLDANDFRVNGESGNTIVQEIQHISDTMRPVILEQSDKNPDDYIMKVEAGIPFYPVSQE